MPGIYEIHIFELRNEEINVKKILADINATYGRGCSRMFHFPV